MSLYSSRALGYTKFGVFSAFGGGGLPIFGPFSFAEAWSSDDFFNPAQFTSWVKPYLDQVNRKDLTWVPPSSSILTRASSAWSIWKQAAEAEGGQGPATTYVASKTGTLNDLIAHADTLSLTSLPWPATPGHRSESVEVQRYDAFNQISAIAKQIAASSAAATTALNNAMSAANYVPPSALPSAGGSPTGSSLVNNPQQNALNVSSQGSMASAGGDNTILYVGLGVGALALIGGVMYFRKKSSAVAGYRRRRR